MAQGYRPLLSRLLARMDFSALRHDLIAAVTNALLALPQGIAFATIAGLPPEYGLYTAIVVPLVAALLGSSRHLVSGPTTAISLMVFATLAPQIAPGTVSYVAAALVLTLMVGIFQLIFGLLRLGHLVTFISYSVIVGFCVGAAFLIATTQLSSALGLDVSGGIGQQRVLDTVFTDPSSVNSYAIGIAATTIVAALIVKRISPRLPYFLIAVIIGSVACYVLGGSSRGVEFVPEISSVVPVFGIPNVSVSILRDLTAGALAIAIVGLIESVSIARSIALKSHQELDTNREFAGQGLSNIVGCLFSAYAGSGSFARSALNYESGARTSLAAILTGPLLLLILAVSGPLLRYIPIPAIAGLILLVAWNLFDFRAIRRIFRRSRLETVITIATCAGVLLVDIPFGIFVGVMLSLGAYLNRTMHTSLVAYAPNLRSRFRTFVRVDLHEVKECPQLLLTRLQGPLYFGAIESIRSEFKRLASDFPQQKHLFVRVEGSSGIDLSGARVLVEENERRKVMGGGLYLSTGYEPLRKQFAELQLSRSLGRGHVFRRKAHAIACVVPKLDPKICESCTARIFYECPPAD